MNTILITGCSSGYGLETARHFDAQGWNVIATMRTPREGVLPESVRVLALDVTDPASISAALEAAGPIDVLVNNAGIGALGAFEATPLATVRELFETNTFGVMAVTQAVLPAVPRAPLGRDRQRDVERRAGPDAARRPRTPRARPRSRASPHRSRSSSTSSRSR